LGTWTGWRFPQVTHFIPRLDPGSMSRSARVWPLFYECCRRLPSLTSRGSKSARALPSSSFYPIDPPSSPSFFPLLFLSFIPSPTGLEEQRSEVPPTEFRHSVCKPTFLCCTGLSDFVPSAPLRTSLFIPSVWFRCSSYSFIIARVPLATRHWFPHPFEVRRDCPQWRRSHDRQPSALEALVSVVARVRRNASTIPASPLARTA
jgi:hypothetical protein